MQQIQANPNKWYEDIYQSLLNVKTKIYFARPEDITHFHNPAHYSTQPATIDEVVTELEKLSQYESYQCEDSRELNQDIFNILKPNLTYEDSLRLKGYKFASSAIVQVHFQYQIDRDKQDQILICITGPKAIHDEALQIIHENFIICKERPYKKINFEKDIKVEYQLMVEGTQEDGREIEDGVVLSGTHYKAKVYPVPKGNVTFTQYMLTIEPEHHVWDP